MVRALVGRENIENEWKLDTRAKLEATCTEQRRQQKIFILIPLNSSLINLMGRTTHKWVDEHQFQLNKIRKILVYPHSSG